MHINCRRLDVNNQKYNLTKKKLYQESKMKLNYSTGSNTIKCFTFFDCIKT